MTKQTPIQEADIIVCWCRHAGCEAALAASRMGVVFYYLLLI
jgi:tRNA U34 5-carboxymethylaminomethyl modifying enzyme MnmG/GidA